MIKEVSQSYLTMLWNNDTDKKPDEERSFVHLLSRYFTLVLFLMAAITAVYWSVADRAKVWDAVTAVLIVACPCALLLCNAFTNGNILRILGRNGLYLRNAQNIEDIAGIDHIVFDKTGTLTTGRYQDVEFEGEILSDDIKMKVASLAAQSTHPMSKAIVGWCGAGIRQKVVAFKEYPGEGIEGIVGDDLLMLGSAKFIKCPAANTPGSVAYVVLEARLLGKFSFRNNYRNEIPSFLRTLREKYPVSVLSGDNNGEQAYLHRLLGENNRILFNQSPQDKLEAVRSLQEQGKKVMMIGDGLNDAGALKQADVGIAVAEDHNVFTPASDGIMKAAGLSQLYRYISLCRMNRKVVMTAFIVSVLYNMAGLFFATQAMLSPMTAAVLMPASSLTILFITFGTSTWLASKLGLK